MKKLFLVSLTLMFMLALTTWVIAGDSNSDWSPQYGEKGELLNPQPAVNISNIANDINISEPPLILTTLLTEDFESAWTPDAPPVGPLGAWSIIDNGTEGSQCWWTDDWHRDYYSTWADTAARIYYSGSQEINYEEWLITPSLNIPGGATACSLVFRNYYYDDGAGKDTAYVLGSIDDGATWTDTLAVWDATQSSAYLNFDITGYSGQSTVKFAFLLTCNTGSYMDIYYWWLDEVAVYSDASQLLFEEFSGWGPGGNDPPTDWTIIDNGTPKAAEAPWNDNDWHKNTRWTSGTARLYYESSYKEWEDDWLISPSIIISSGALCTLSVVEYYNHSTSGYEWKDMDHGYILVSTDGGTTWPDTIADHTATLGSSTTKTTFSYDIGAYSGQTIKIAFNFVNGPYDYDYWSIDDVSVNELVMAAYDVLTSAINAPTWGITGYDWDVSSQVTNIGLNTVTFEDSTYIYELNKLTHFFEDFSNPQGWTGANPPINTLGAWAVIDSGSNNDGWNNNDWYGYYYSTWSDTVARVYYGSYPYEDQNEWLITPSLDFTGQTDIHLTFKTYYDDISSTGDDTAWVLITNDGWTTTNVLAMWNEDHGSSSSPANPDFDISTWADNNSTVQIAFKYVANNDWYWYVDKVEIYSILPPTVDYVSGETVVDLVSLESRDISYFDSWNSPDAGNYQVTSFTALGTDEDPSNDTLTINTTVYEHYEHGGPDDGYYSWDTDKDGGTGGAYSWIDIVGPTRNTVTWDLGSSDNRYTSSIAMGFDFNFYGNTFDRIFLSENGFATFDSITTTINYTNSVIPSSSGSENLLALIWDDLSGIDNGTAYYYTNNIDTFIITYENWDFDTDHDQRIDAQIILCGSDNNIKFQYKEIGPVIYTSHTIGIENAAGDVGLEYVYNGDPLGNIAMPGLAITFSYNPPQIDGALTSIDIPADGGYYRVGESFTPTVTISALGNDAFTAQVTLKIYDETPTLVYNQTETSATVPGLGSIQHAFATGYTTDAEGVFDVEAFVVVSQDANTANDSLTSDFEVFTHYSEGGPDEYGYRFVDNLNLSTVLDPPPAPTFNWIEISATGINAGDGTGAYGRFPIGFSFPFYGQVYTDVFIYAYGYVTFDSSYYSAYNDCPLPSTSSPYDPMVAGFWDSGYPDAADGGAVYYETFGTEPNRYTVIQYENHSYSTYYMNTFEIILYENGNILMQYLEIDDSHATYDNGIGSSATVGIQSDTTLVPDRSGLVYECGTSTSLSGGNFLSDSLAILFYYYEPAIDPVMVSLDAPLGGEVGTETFPAVTVENNGSSAMTIDVTVEILDAGLVSVYDITETTVSIAAGATVQHTFTSGWIPLAVGEFTAEASVFVSGDEFDDNNDASIGLTVYDALIDFEADNGGLLGYGDWEWGIPTSGPNSANSGLNVWATNLSGDYIAGLHTLEFKLNVGPSNATFTFAQWYYTESGYDGGNFAVSTDGGSNWIVVSPDRGYDRIASSLNPLYPDSIFSGYSQQFWEGITFDLSAYADMVIDARLALGADASGFYPGWYVDDFGFIGCELFLPAKDAQVVSIDAPIGALSQGETYDVVATITNNGSQTVTFDVTASDNYTFTNTQQVREIEQYATVQVNFPGWLINHACSTYILTVAAELADDEYTGNDTLTADYGSFAAFNNYVQYDDGVVDGGLWMGGAVDHVLANKFDVPYDGAELSAIDFQFWVGFSPGFAENDSVRVCIFLDGDDNGIPDITPTLCDTLLAKAGGNIWSIGCGDSYITLNCESFWAGFAMITPADSVAISFDDGNDNNMGWSLVFGDTDTTWYSDTWYPGGDMMVRAYFYGDPVTAPDIGLGSTEFTGYAYPTEADTASNTIQNTGTVCDLEYTVSIMQYVIGPTSAVPSRGEPIDWVPVNDKIEDIHAVSVDQKEILQPVYPPMTLGSGGPDAYGYEWIDSDDPAGPTYGWIDISTLGTEISWHEHPSYDSLDDSWTDPIAMGMSFNFYGVDYSDIVVSTNGWASFLPQTDDHYWEDPIPDTDDPNALLAVYWDDLEGQYPTGTYGSAYYYYNATENQFILSWTNWHHNYNSEILNFQIILDGDDQTVTYQYANVHSSETDYTVGIENADGTVGLQVANSQAYLHSSLAVLFEPPPEWLSTDLVDGTIGPLSAQIPFDIFMDATELEEGVYNGKIVITSNDPDEPVSAVDVTFEVCDGGEITGTVFDEDGTTPLADVVVEAYNSVPELVGVDTTDVDGLYGFIVDPDTHSLTFAKEDYTDTSLTGIVVILCGTTQADDMVMSVAGFAYLPGDVSMALGVWPPIVLGGDRTHLIGYLLMQGHAACMLDGFWASADINGDCVILGGDATALLNYIIGGGSITHCPDYEPLWPTPDDLPDTAPEGWPNCDTPPVTGVKIIPVDSAE